MSGAHECPIEGCNVPVPDDKLMCLKHWKLVPNDLARNVYRQYRLGPASYAHLASCADAVAAVNEAAR